MFTTFKGGVNEQLVVVCTLTRDLSEIFCLQWSQSWLERVKRDILNFDASSSSIYWNVQMMWFVCSLGVGCEVIIPNVQPFSWNFPVKLAEAVDYVYIIWIYPLKFNIDTTDTTISLLFPRPIILGNPFISKPNSKFHDLICRTSRNKSGIFFVVSQDVFVDWKVTQNVYHLMVDGFVWPGWF